jgi:hypothetical protein
VHKDNIDVHGKERIVCKTACAMNKLISIGSIAKCIQNPLTNQRLKITFIYSKPLDQSAPQDHFRISQSLTNQYCCAIHM